MIYITKISWNDPDHTWQYKIGLDAITIWRQSLALSSAMRLLSAWAEVRTPWVLSTYRFHTVIFTARHVSYVCHTRVLWQNQSMHCGYFDTARMGNHSSFPIPTVVGGRQPLPSKICAQSGPTPFAKRRLREISDYNVSTVRDSEKVQLWRIGSRPQRATDGVRTLPLSRSKADSKGDFLFFFVCE